MTIVHPRAPGSVKLAAALLWLAGAAGPLLLAISTSGEVPIGEIRFIDWLRMLPILLFGWLMAWGVARLEVAPLFMCWTFAAAECVTLASSLDLLLAEGEMTTFVWFMLSSAKSVPSGLLLLLPSSLRAFRRRDDSPEAIAGSFA